MRRKNMSFFLIDPDVIVQRAETSAAVSKFSYLYFCSHSTSLYSLSYLIFLLKQNYHLTSIMFIEKYPLKSKIQFRIT